MVEGEIGTEPLYLFTTLEEPAGYNSRTVQKERWLVETDLRSLKEQVKLQHQRENSADGCYRTLLAVAAYNLIRAVMRKLPDRLARAHGV